MARQVEHDTYAEHLTGVVEGGVASRDAGERFAAPQVAFKKRTLAQLAEAIIDSFERPVWCRNQMKTMSMFEGGWNALDKFLHGRTELLSYGVARICDLAANRNQDVCAAFDQAQRREAIRLGGSAVNTSIGAKEVSITLTSTIWTASQILSRIFPARSNPGTGANCKRSTPVKSTSWPMLAAIPSAPPMASIARYNVWVSVELAEINRRTERVWVYPSVCSMGVVRLRFE